MNFSDVFRMEISENKDFVVAVLVYKMTVKNTNLKMCPLDSLTSKMYNILTQKSVLYHVYKPKYTN